MPGRPNLDDAFFPALEDFARSIGTPAEYLLRALWAESRLDPGPNSHRSGSQYYGLNQLNAGFLQARGVDPSAYLQMSASEQLRVGVIPYWKAQIATGIATPLRSPGVVQAIQLAPGRVKDGAPGRVLYSAPETNYYSNKGVDANGDGAITIGDLDTFFERMTKAGDWPIYLKEAARLSAAKPWLGEIDGIAGPAATVVLAAAALAGAIGYAVYTYTRR